MRNHGSGSVDQISARPKVTLSQMSRLFIDILHIAAVVTVRTINSRTKKRRRKKVTSKTHDYVEKIEI